jgi:hypothetical protein
MQRGLEALDRFAKVFGAEAECLMMDRHDEMSASYKIANIVLTAPDVIATGNIGCIAQIASGTSIPVLHTIELLDFAYGGFKLDGLESAKGSPRDRAPLAVASPDRQ